jgi:hypothetical protein
MAIFSPFKTLEEALLYFGIAENTQNLFPSVPNTHIVPTYLVEELEFNTTKLPYNVSEASLCEMVIFPILKAVWKNFTEKLLLWSHKAIGKDADISGIPDYILAKRSHLGRVMDLPFLIMIEAKKDDFDAGWGQCVAQMVTAQSLNNNEQEIYGIVTNGTVWEISTLKSHIFTKHNGSFSLQELPTLYNRLYHLFEICEAKIK